MCTEKTIKNHFRKYQTIKAQIDELKKQAKKEELWIFEEFKDKEPTIDGKKIIIEYTRKTIDSKRLENELPDIYKMFSHDIPVKYVNTRVNL